MSIAPSFPLENYWNEFEISDQDLDFINNLLLEREAPLTIEDMTEALVEHRLQDLKQKVEDAARQALAVYRPEETYQVGQKLIFQANEGRVGEVTGVRLGDNPAIGVFDVIQVTFEGDGAPREFASRLLDHSLNIVPEPSPDDEVLLTSSGVSSRYGSEIKAKITSRLNQAQDIVRIAWRWFPKALLADIHEGHLNLAEAVLDVSEGGPLPTQSLLEHVEIPEDLDPLLAEFSLDYALQEDDRFDEVGPAGQVLWFLKRLEPPELHFPPTRLQYDPLPIDRSRLTPELLDLESRLDDELVPVQAVPEVQDEVILPLLFPHWRVGALPLSARLRPLFPTAYEAPRIRFILVDGHSQEKFPGWVLRNLGYVLGLEDFYRKHDVPAGGLIKVKQGEHPGEVIVETLDPQQRKDWIRTVTIDPDGRIGFTMLKQKVGTAYDDLMVVGLLDAQALDEAWLNGSQRKLPVDRIALGVFRELARLNPQSAVHAQALYSGLNVIRRLAPSVVFSELVSQAYYEHVGDLYWRLDEEALESK